MLESPCTSEQHSTFSSHENALSGNGKEMKILLTGSLLPWERKEVTQVEEIRAERNLLCASIVCSSAKVTC